jgi:hypothetical protein
MALKLGQAACLVFVFVCLDGQMIGTNPIVLIPALPLLACCLSFQTVSTSGGDTIKSR